MKSFFAQVAQACRASMAVPFLLSAVPTADGDLLVDGGILDNCPMHAFDDTPSRAFSEYSHQKDSSAVLTENPVTLGFCITTVDQPREVYICVYMSSMKRMDLSETVSVDGPNHDYS